VLYTTKGIIVVTDMHEYYSSQDKDLGEGADNLKRQWFWVVYFWIRD